MERGKKKTTTKKRQICKVNSLGHYKKSRRVFTHQVINNEIFKLVSAENRKLTKIKEIKLVLNT